MDNIFSASFRVVDVYTIDKKFSDSEIAKISSALTNPLTQQVSLNNTAINGAGYAVEIGFLPGVTDNIAHTTQEIIEDLLRIKFASEEAVYTSQLVFLQIITKNGEIEKIASSLINPIIQRIHIKDAKLYKKDQGMDLIIPKVKLTTTPQVTEVVRLRLVDLRVRALAGAPPLASRSTFAEQSTIARAFVVPCSDSSRDSPALDVNRLGTMVPVGRRHDSAAGYQRHFV
jgi:hypothetical protein